MLRSWVPTASSSSRFWRSRTSPPTIATLTNVNSANATARRTASRRHTGSAGRAAGGSVAGLIASAAAALRRLEAQHAVERERPATAGEQEQQERGPRQVLGVRVRIDGGLDDHDHTEKRQRGQPRAEAEDQQGRAAH